MNKILQPLLFKCVLVFFDDILIYNKNKQEHISHVRQVLDILRLHQFYAKVSKCTFMVEEVEYLGHIVSKDGIWVDLAKVKCIKEWP